MRLRIIVKLLEIDSDEVDAYYNRGNAYLVLEEYYNAIDWL